ncbi:MAG: AAA family ATPase, partial [Acholeplasma sp.]|nr:AAA family ATPase [Acholeplasma sp.]
SDDPYYTMNTKIRNLVALYQSIYDFDLGKFKSMIEYFNLKDDKPINSFSKGMRRQLYISLAIACRPKLLLLDEAFDGLDPKARLVFKRELINLVENEETAIIISSHSLRELEAISDSFGILEDGKFTTSGNINEELERINKYQLGFSNEVNETLFKELNPLNIQILGRVVKLVLKGSIDDNKEKLRKLNPIFIDIIPIDFEELFIYEVEGKGDLK